MSLEVSIKKKVGSFCLDASFTAENEILALLGASGCGKSMTLRCIAGIETPDQGYIRLGGRTLFDSEKKINLPPQERKVGYLFQNYALFPHMTIAQNIACGIGGTKEEKAQRVKECLASFFLEGYQGHYPFQLSGGQQQRVALARIWASKPEIMLLDEPFSALDSYLQWQLERELARQLESFGSTVLFVSHNRDEAYRLCQRIAVMDNGHIEAVNEKHALFSAPETLSGALLTGCKNVSKATLTGENTLYAEDWGIELEGTKEIPSDIQYVGIRAHSIAIVSGTQEQNTVECDLVAQVEEAFSMMLVLRKKGVGSQNKRANIYVALPKEEWQKQKDKDSFFLRLPSPELLLLR